MVVFSRFVLVTIAELLCVLSQSQADSLGLRGSTIKSTGDIPKVPNVEFLGMTWSPWHMNSDQQTKDPGMRGRIFKFKYDRNCVGFGYLIPDVSCSSFAPRSGTTINDNAVYSYNASSYQFNLYYESSFSKSLSLQGLEIDYFDLSVKASLFYNYAANFFASNIGVIVTSRAKCEAWDASLSPYMAPNEQNLVELDEDYIYAVSKLPVEYDFDAYKAFIDIYGAFYTKYLLMGAKATAVSFFDEVTFASMQSEGLDIDACASESNWGHSTAQSGSVDISASAKEFDQKAKAQYNGNFHGPPPPKDPAQWQESVKADPYPLRMTLAPQTDIFTPAWFPEDENILKKQFNYLKAQMEYCDKTGECYKPTPSPKVLWEPEVTTTGAQTKQLVMAKDTLCVLSEVYKGTRQYCHLDLRQVVGEVNYYWFLQGSGDKVTCSAICSKPGTVSWASINNSPLRVYSLSVPYKHDGVHSNVLSTETTSHCTTTRVENLVGCFDYCKLTYIDGHYVQEQYTADPWDDKHADLNSGNRVCDATCFDTKGTKTLVKSVDIVAGNGVVALTRSEEAWCEVVTWVVGCPDSPYGSGCHLKIQEVVGQEGSWWTGEALNSNDPSYHCQAHCYINCYSI